MYVTMSVDINAPPERYFKVTLVEAGPRLLPPLPEDISARAKEALETLGVDVRLSTMVTEAGPDGLKTSEGELIPACLMVWAAGIKAPEFLADIAGLDTNRINQLIVNAALQTTQDPHIFAIGDAPVLRSARECLCPPGPSRHTKWP